MATDNTELSAVNNVARRPGYAEYPTIWSFDYVQSIKSEYAEVGDGAYANRRNELKDNMRMMLNEKTDPLVKLENVNILHRLGISYHFEDEIKKILDGIYCTIDLESGVWKDNLYATALKFRLLRQHRYSVPQEIFNDFMDESGKFKECVGNDIMGLLSLYEASFLLMPGENILEGAIDFTTKNLQEFVKQSEIGSYLSALVGHALEVPLHWRVPRLEARWFIDLSRRSHKIMNPTFLELSMLDYNIVQSIYQEELRQLSRWWRDLKIREKMNFFRDRLVENLLWNITMICEPQHAYCRKMETKLFNFMAMLDDSYDVYGTLDELELLTTAIVSWDVKAMDQLPYYMKMTFLTIFNFTNKVAFYVLNQQGLHVIKYLKNMWADVCKAYIREAKWYRSGTTPTFNEYVENAWVSVAVQVVLYIAYFCAENPITKEALEQLDAGYPSIVRQSSLIIRFRNDLATDSFEKKNGDVPTSIRCYMHETGVSEEEARRHIFSLSVEAWKQMNEDRLTHTAFSSTFIESVTNYTRMAMWLYDGRDGYGVNNQGLTKECASSVFVNPISLDD